MKFLKNKRAFDPRNEPSRRLTVAYVLALILIASFSIGTHYFIVRVMTVQKEMARVSYYADRQRMLSQQVVLFSLRYSEKGRDEDRRNALESIGEFERVHKFLAHLSVEPGMSTRFKRQSLYDIYFLPPYDLDIKAGLFVKKTRDFLNFQKGDNIFQRDMSLEYTRNLAMGPLLALLDKVATTYQTEVMAEMKRMEDVQLRAVFIVLGVLFLEMVLIFWPLVKHVQAYSRQLMDLALYDYLTGLNNRWAFMERAVGELSRAERHKRAYCFVMADIDGFKTINDTYGHEAGDRVLRHFADSIKNGLRSEDIIGRIGGEEFSIFLPETPADGGMRAMERMRRLAEKSVCDIGHGRTLQYTVSFGLVGNDKIVLTSVDELMRLADEALYKAKQGGRNRVEQAPQPEGSEAEGDEAEDMSGLPPAKALEA